jgi:hypothetical protein
MRDQRTILLDDFPPPSGDGEPPLGEQVVERLASTVRTVYCACYREKQGDPTYGQAEMPQWDGGEDQFGRRCKRIWPDIARRIVEIGAEPISFVRAQFWVRGQDTRPPPPNYLLSDAALARYRTYLAQAAFDAQREYERGLRTVQGEVLLVTRGLGWEYQRALRYVLLNITTVQVSALYRYVLAAREELRDVAQRFHDQALLQYVFQLDMFDAALGDLIPDSLRQEGRTLREQILGGTVT